MILLSSEFRMLKNNSRLLEFKAWAISRVASFPTKDCHVAGRREFLTSSFGTVTLNNLVLSTILTWLIVRYPAWNIMAWSWFSNWGSAGSKVISTLERNPSSLIHTSAAGILPWTCFIMFTNHVVFPVSIPNDCKTRLLVFVESFVWSNEHILCGLNTLVSVSSVKSSQYGDWCGSHSLLNWCYIRLTSRFCEQNCWYISCHHSC